MKFNKKLRGKRFKFNFNLERFGEFIPSFNSWMSPDEQRKRVEKINEELDK
ncbi:MULTISPECIES: hypothetical protein [unclassified Caloramator]|uniref:hypothetical protein n=1 Tax=unclassified Caloramator TaxID=2629145 RepID=UPI00237E88EC|nr:MULTISPECIES: hypothetical protein [unclassified Caloramator]MDO6354652.1 hypothetical protein [Caloramator sp. CAR-1]WDU83226.1 hypothetical protein PWK10_00150 [Caloramator sp. Dgby_cultured_2]